MAGKKVDIGKKPTSKNQASTDVDNWVSSNTGESNKNDSQKTQEAKPKMKRLTIDVTEELHRAIKMKAVEAGTPMADMLRSLLEENYL